MATDNNDFTHEFQIYSTDKNAGTMGTGKFLLFDDNINAVKVEDVSNIKIGGGEEGQVLITDGEGNLTWATSSGGGGVAVNADWNSSSGASRILNKPDLTAYLPKTGGTLTGKLNAAQGSGTTGGYSFGGTEGGNDTGMFSNADGVLDFYANDVKIVTVTTSGVTSTQAITLPSNPTSNLQAATKQYVDSSVSALNNFSGNYNDLTNKPTVATSAYIGTTQVAFNRSSGALTLEGVSIDGNAATVSNGVYTNGTYANPAWITSLAYSKLTDAPDLATVATTGSYADLTNKPSLATVATTGSYSDLTNRPTIFSGDYADLANKPVLFDGAYLSLTGLPNLAAVATSGSYDDLSNKPSIPAAQVNADWNETISESPAFIFNKPSIPDLTGYATEAWVNAQGFGSGGAGASSYNDLTDKPTIPSSLSDLGITAGSNGQVLTLNSSLVPVWATPSGGGQTFDQSLNTTDVVTFDLLTVTDSAGITNFNGERISNIYVDGKMYVGSNVTQTPVSILIGGAGPRNEWAFTPDGKLTLPEIGTGIGWTNTDTAPTPDTEFLYSSTISFDKNQGIVLNNAVGEGSFSWILGKDGTLTVPGSITQNERLTLNSVGVESGYVAAVLADGNLGRVFLRTLGGEDAILQTWEFNKEGKLILPAGGDIVDIAGNSVLSGGSGATSLSALSDVSIEGPIEGSVLTWNDNQSRWENRSIPSSSEITNTDGNSTWSVSVSETGIVTMTTARGSLEFGAQPEEGAPQHLHIMRPAGQEGSSDLYFGDDYNYVKLPSSSYSQQGVEIGSSLNQGAVGVWRFGTDGNLTTPGNIYGPNNGSTLVLGQAVDSNNAFVSIPSFADGGELLTIQNNFNADTGGIQVNTNGYLDLNGKTVNLNGSTSITAIAGSYQWRFNNDGKFQLPNNGIIQQNGSYTRTTTPGINGATTNEVVWTSLYNDISSAKLTIQLETNEVDDTTGWHTQICEAIIASRGSFIGGDPVMTVYGVTYTSTVPLATFTVQRNPTTQQIEVVATRTAATVEGISFRINSVEMKTRD